MSKTVIHSNGQQGVTPRGLWGKQALAPLALTSVDTFLMSSWAHLKNNANLRHNAQIKQLNVFDFLYSLQLYGSSKLSATLTEKKA